MLLICQILVSFERYYLIIDKKLPLANVTQVWKIVVYNNTFYHVNFIFVIANLKNFKGFKVNQQIKKCRLTLCYTFHSNLTGRRSGLDPLDPVYLNGVECSGKEQQIVGCKNAGWNVYQRKPYCSMHRHDAAVECFSEGQYKVIVLHRCFAPQLLLLFLRSQVTILWSYWYSLLRTDCAQGFQSQGRCTIICNLCHLRALNPQSYI